MRPSLRRPLRVVVASIASVVGIIAGAVSASILFDGLLLFVFFAFVLGGGGDGLIILAIIAAIGVVIAVPLAGAFFGIRWALRRNRRDAAIHQPSEPAA